MEKKDLDRQETVEIQKNLHRQSQGTSFLRTDLVIAVMHISNFLFSSE